MAAFVSLFAGNKLHIAVLTDIAQGQKGKVESLRRNRLLGSGHVLTAAEFCNQQEADVEDILGEPPYLDLVNHAFGLGGNSALSSAALAATGEKSQRVLRRVEAAMRVLASAPEFDHYIPAWWLIQHPDFLSPQSSELKAALDRFEALFKRLNGLLPAV